MSISLRHPIIKYVAIGIAAIILMILAVTPLVTAIVEGLVAPRRRASVQVGLPLH